MRRLGQRRPWLAKFAWCLLGCSVASSPVDSQSAAPAASVSYRGLELLSGSCEFTLNFCAERSPKAWTEADVAIVRSALEEIAASPLGRALIQGVQGRGTKTLRRYDLAPIGARSRAGGISAVTYGARRSNFIELLDLFFEQSGVLDSRGGYRLVAKILAHEMFHVIDDNGSRFSEAGDAFPALVGFTRTQTGWNITGVTVGDVEEHNRAAGLEATLQDRGDHQGAWEASRGWATAFRVPRPSLLAWNSPAEAFAEIGAHVLLDPTTEKYLPRQIFEYFNAQVFPVLSQGKAGQ